MKDLVNIDGQAFDAGFSWGSHKEYVAARRELLTDLAWDEDKLADAMEFCDYYVPKSMLKSMQRLMMFQPKQDTPEHRAIERFQAEFNGMIKPYIDFKMGV